MSTCATHGVLPAASWVTEEYFQREAPALLSGRPAVRRVESLAEEVWEVEFEDGRKIVAKQQLFGFLARSSSEDLLAVEEKVLGLLRRDGCPVPMCLGADHAEQIIFLEHVGGLTLDDLVQSDRAAPSYARRAVAGLLAIERSCSDHREELEPLVCDPVNEQALQVAWQAARRGARQGLEALHRHLGGGTPSPGACKALEEMGNWLASRPSQLGATDYNARNLVVEESTGALSFIEFARIGFDWSERRLVQYTTGLGSGRDEGRLRDLLDAETAALYQQNSGRPDGARALDFHRLFFLLNGAAMLTNALEAPEAAPGARLLSLWKNPERRLMQFAADLSRSLSGDPLAESFRSELKLRQTNQNNMGEIR